MEKRLLLQLAVLFFLGSAGVIIHPACLIFAVLFLGVWAYYIHRIVIKRLVFLGFIIVYFITLLGGFFNAYYYEIKKEQAIIYYETHETLRLQGKLYKKEIKEKDVRFYLKDVSDETGRLPGRFVVYGVSAESDDMSEQKTGTSFVKGTTISENQDASGLFEQVTKGRLARMNGGQPSLGTILIVEAKALPLHVAENEGGFDQAKYLYAQQIYGAGTATSIKAVKEPRFLFNEWLYRYRLKVTDFYTSFLPGEEGGLLGAMVLGEKSELDAEAKRLFQRAGLSHILAISGLHLSIIGGLLYRGFRRLGLSFTPAAILSVPIILSFSVMTGNSISMQRAVGMFLLMLLSEVVGQAYDLLSALSVMALYTMVCNPFCVFNAAFVFSYGAILGIACVVGPVGKAYEGWCKRRWETIYKNGHGKAFKKSLGETITKAFLSGLFIQLSTIPLVAYFYYVIPTYAIFLNMLLLPVMGVLLLSGLVAGLLQLPILLWICHLFLYAYEWLADMSIHLPGASIITGMPSIWMIVVYYLILAVFVYWLCCGNSDELGFMWERGFVRIPGLSRIWGFVRLLGWMLRRGVVYWPRRRKIYELLKKRNPRGLQKYIRLTYYIRKRLLFSVCVGILLVFLLSIHPIQGFQVDMLSVGQGDGIYIQSEDGMRLFVDGGSSSDEHVGNNTILPYLMSGGIRHIDYWIVTHLDEDHYNGLLEVLESGYQVDTVILSNASKDMEESVAEAEGASVAEAGGASMAGSEGACVAGAEGASVVWAGGASVAGAEGASGAGSVVSSESGSVSGYLRLLELCKRNNTDVRYIKSGDRISSASLQLDFLYPPSPSVVSGTNENSIVFTLISEGFKGIFTGDLGAEQEKLLVNNGLLGGESRELNDGAQRSAEDDGESKEQTFDLYKVGHHGSKNSSSQEFLEYIKARYAIISAGKNNRYGHPSGETIERLDGEGTVSYCTIESGRLRVSVEDGKVKIEGYLKGT